MSDRGVSEVLSFVLVFTLIVASIAVVSVSGIGALRDARDAEQMNNAERAFDVLSDNLADVHQRGAPSRATEINLERAGLYTADNVTFNVSAIDDAGTIENQSWHVRPLVYTPGDERQIVYEGGAVFRTNRDTGIRLVDPPFVFRGDERVLITLPAPISQDVQSVGGSTVLVRTSRSETDVFLTESSSDFDEVWVNVTYQAANDRTDYWRDYFEAEGLDCPGGNNDDTNARCRYDPSADDIDHVYVVTHNVSTSLVR